MLKCRKKYIFYFTSDFVKSLASVLLNPVYVTLILGGTFNSYAISGMFPFLPKYMETQFYMSAGNANICVGELGCLVHLNA